MILFSVQDTRANARVGLVLPLTARRLMIALSTARMSNKNNQRTPLGWFENGVIKDETRGECWFQLSATNAGVLAEAASVRDRSGRPSAKAATESAHGSSIRNMAGCPVRASRQRYATSTMTKNKNYLLSLCLSRRTYPAQTNLI
jgi:hypothetical protein